MYEKDGSVLPRIREGLSPVQRLHTRIGRKHLLSVSVGILLLWWWIYATVWSKTTLNAFDVGEVQHHTIEEILHNPEIKLVSNSTLDFGKIFVINLEHREDRRDDIAMITAAAGLNVTYFTGIPSNELNSQTLPDDYGTPYMTMETAHLACFRGHANLWRMMVEENIQTALVLEDDVDFDLNIREVMPRVKAALQKITATDNAWTNHDVWDFLYLGTCYEQPYAPETYDQLDTVAIEIPSDAENLSDQMFGWVEVIMDEYYQNITMRRTLIKSKNPVCTHAYAITLRAAKRLLLETNNWLPFPIDISMIHYLNRGKFLAYSIMPPLATQWRYIEDPYRNSDIEKSAIEIEKNWGHKRSARKSLEEWVNFDNVQYEKWWQNIHLRE